MLWDQISILYIAVATASAYVAIERRKNLRDEYDYVIIGGGLSGLVVANRLTEDFTSMFYARYFSDLAWSCFLN